jgi:hypothetical protein
MKMLIAFAALLALVAAQCSPEGHTYVDEDGRSVTFGAAVGDWVPGLIAHEEYVAFATWTQATSTRWTVQEFESTADWYCDQKGQYSLEFFNGCNELHLTTISDSCADRMALFKSTFTLHSPSGECAGAGSQLMSHFPESEEFVRFSGDAVTFVFGENHYALVSVGKSAVFVQRWRLGEEGDEDLIEVVDLASYPAGFACNPNVVGRYLTNWEEECSSRFCGEVDECALRAELFHDTAFNDFQGDRCSNDVEGADDAVASCSDGRQWLKHPWDCINQEVPGGCMYCKGVAMGESTMWCLNKEGGDCETIFESAPRKAFCNQEFECPASTTSLSIVLLICSVLAFFLH